MSVSPFLHVFALSVMGRSDVETGPGRAISCPTLAPHAVLSVCAMACYVFLPPGTQNVNFSFSKPQNSQKKLAFFRRSLGIASKRAEVHRMFKVSSVVFRAAALASSRHAVRAGVQMAARPVAGSSSLFSTATEPTTTHRPEPQTAPTLTQVCHWALASHTCHALTWHACLYAMR